MELTVNDMKNDSFEIIGIITLGIIGISQVLFNKQWAQLSNWWMNATTSGNLQSLGFGRFFYYCFGSFSIVLSIYLLFS